MLGDALPAPADRLGDDALLASLLAALRFRAFADSAPALAALRRRGVRVAVVSNWDVSLPGVLRDVGLLERPRRGAHVGAGGIGQACTGDLRRGARACRRQRAAEALHVGDSLEHDVCGARASGLQAILLRRGGEGPDVPGVPVMASLAALPGLLGDSRSAAAGERLTP